MEKNFFVKSHNEVSFEEILRIEGIDIVNEDADEIEIEFISPSGKPSLTWHWKKGMESYTIKLKKGGHTE